MDINNLNIEDHGVCFIKNLLPETLIQNVLSEVQTLNLMNEKAGIRNAEKKISSLSNIIHNQKVLTTAQYFLGGEPRVVRVIFFDKSPEKNWFVNWHQDKTVALNKKIADESWGPWTFKDNTHHAQPPLHVLENMVTFRIHLDATDVDNGCLQVIPGSHKHGILKQNEVNELAKKEKALICEADYGDTLIMRPHIVHSSNKANTPKSRRIIHIEFSSFKLPEKAEWA